MKKLVIALMIAALAIPAIAQDKGQVLPYDVLVRSAKIYLGQRDKDFDAAEERLTQAVENYENPVEALFLLGLIHAEKADYAKMMEAFNRFEEICAQADDQNNKDIKKRCKKDDMPKQIEDTKQSELSKRLEVGLKNLRQADSLLSITDTVSVESLKTEMDSNIGKLLDFSEGAFNEALIISDTIPQIWNNLGNIEKNRGAFEKALSMYEHGYALDSTRSVAVYNMATIHFDLGQYTEAGRFYGRFAQLDTVNAKVAYINQAMAYQNSGNLPGLKSALDDVLKIDPQDPEMRYQRGMYYIQRVNDAEFRDSIALYDSISAAAPKDEEAKSQLNALVDRRKALLGDAISDFEVATQVNPSDDIAWYWLGSAAFFLENNELATKAYEKCVEANSGSKDCWCQLALIYTRAGQREKAVAANDKCETLE